MLHSGEIAAYRQRQKQKERGEQATVEYVWYQRTLV